MSSFSRGHSAEKGARYLGLLDQALCNAQWSEVAELARKTEKHAPERKCKVAHYNNYTNPRLSTVESQASLSPRDRKHK